MRKGSSGFTLVEILIVVVILGILAATVVPQFAAASTDAKISTTAATVNQVQKRVLIYYGTNGEYPGVIDPAWFADNQLPRNPFSPDIADSVYYNLGAPVIKVHPTVKDFSDPSLKVFWYNPTNGRFRARVPLQATDADTLALYNRVHKSVLTSISAETD